MDIQRWLDDTELPEQPPSPASHAKRRDAAFDLPKQKPDEASGKKRRRKPSTSDSSLLDASSQLKRRQPVAPQAILEESSDKGTSSDAFRSSTGSEGSASSQPYARRPRRKTRLERYEPASKHIKEQGTHSHRHRRGEPSRTKRRRKRSKVDNVGAVQTFQAKNVSKDRLTLKPREKLGLFSKGRASTPVKGRGLPDLVFSEMKFLQSHKGRPDAELKTNLPKKKRKKDPTHAKEEAISAYFTAVRPALEEKEVNKQVKEVSQKQLQDTDRRETEPPSGVDNAVPTVEVADQASYLGFGSRGPRHESGSYISWSESIRALSATPARPRVSSTIRTNQCDHLHDVQDGKITGSGEPVLSRPVPPTVVPCMPEGSGDRFQVSSLLPANDRISRSHSLPQHTSTPQRAETRNRNQGNRRQTIGSSASPPSTSLFIRGPTDSQSDIHRAFNGAPPSIPTGFDPAKEVQDPASVADAAANPEGGPLAGDGADARTSSTLGRMLENCNAAFHMQRQAAAPLRTRVSEVESSRLPSRGHRETYPTIQRIPTVRFADVDEIYPSRTPVATAANIYAQQQNRQPFIEHDFEDYNPQQTYLNVHDLDGEEEGYDTHEWEQVEHGPENGDNDSYWEEEFAETVGFDYGRRQTNKDDIVNLAHSNDAVVRPGFWRPNKLY